MMKLSLFLCVLQTAWAFQPISQPRSLKTTSLKSYYNNPYMLDDYSDRIGRRNDPYSSYGRRYRPYNPYYDEYRYSGGYNSGYGGGARVPYDSYDAYGGGYGMRTLAPDQVGDVTGRAREYNSRRRYGGYGGGYNSYYGNGYGNGGYYGNGYGNGYYGNGYGNGGYGYGGGGYGYGRGGYYGNGPYYERSSYGYASPVRNSSVRAVRPDGTLSENKGRRYGGEYNRYGNRYGGGRGYGNNLYVDEDRFSNSGRGLYSSGRGVQTPFSRTRYGRRGGRAGGYRERPQGVPIRGGDEETFTVQPNVSSVRVVLQTEGMPLNARLELLRGYGMNQRDHLGEVFRDIDQGPFETIIATPDQDSKVRIFNSGPVEYTIYAWLEPNTYGQSSGGRGNRSRYGYGSRYTSPQSVSRFDQNGRIRDRW